jgi:hypothetical protein
MSTFSKIHQFVTGQAKRRLAHEQETRRARLEAFLDAISKLEQQYGCEVQARLQSTPQAIVAVVHAVVVDNPKVTNARPTEEPAAITVPGGVPAPEAGQDAPAQP